MSIQYARAISFGEILYDVFEDGAYLGGAPLNFAWYLRQFGISVAMVSAVGNDELGSRALGTIRDAGIMDGYIRRVVAPTGTVDVALHEGQPTFTINTGVAWDQIELVDEVKIKPELIYYGSLAQRTEINRRCLEHLLHLSPRHRFFDINIRQHFYTQEIIQTGLQHATIAKLNEEECTLLLNMLNLATPTDIVKAYGLQALVVTQGGKGASLYHDEQEYHASSPVVQVVDAVGAGDAFSATMAAAAIQEVSLQRALDVACQVGAFVVTRRGAQATLPGGLSTAFEKR